MILVCNPNEKAIAKLIAQSDQKAAKWLEDQDGDIWAWSAEKSQHAEVANSMGLKILDKGLFIGNH